MKRLLYDRKGLALPLVLMVMAVLVILSTVVLGMGSTDTLHAAAQSNRLQAYYLARSGADAISTYIVSNPDNLSSTQMESLINTMVSSGTSAPFKLSPTDTGTITVEVKKDDTGKILSIKSVGQLNGVSETAIKTININNESIEWMFDKAIFSSGKIDYVNGTINGDIYGMSTINFGDDFSGLHGKVYLRPGATPSGSLTRWNNPWPDASKKLTIENSDKEPSYPALPFPVFPTKPSLTQVTSEYVISYYPVTTGTIDQNRDYTKGIRVEGGTLTLSRNNTHRMINTKYFDIKGGGQVIDSSSGNSSMTIHVAEDFSMMSNARLTINLGDGDVIIRAKNFIMKNGDTVITVNRSGSSKGRLIIYVDNTLDLDNGAKINADPNVVSIYYAGTKAVTLPNGMAFNGLLQTKTADITVTQGSAVKGFIVCGGSNLKVDNGSNTNVLYAPNANVTLTGGGVVTGVIISKNCTLSNGVTVNYVKPDLNALTSIFGSVFVSVNYSYGIWK